MRSIISVVGKDRPGILALVANECASHEANIVDVSQTVLQDMFTMIMICELTDDNETYQQFVTELEATGSKNGLSIHVMHEDIFNAMHTI